MHRPLANPAIFPPRKKPHSGWVNVYQSRNGTIGYGTIVWDTREEAIEAAKEIPARGGTGRVVYRIRIRIRLTKRRTKV